jgi:hypothetical protein
MQELHFYSRFISGVSNNDPPVGGGAVFDFDQKMETWGEELKTAVPV